MNRLKQWLAWALVPTHAIGICVGVLVLVVLASYFSNAIGGARDRVHAYFFDRADAKLEQKVKELETENAALAEVAREERLRREYLAGENKALAAALKDLGVEGEKLDATLQEHRAELEAVRAGGSDVDPGTDALARDLRELYPAKRRGAKPR